MCKILKTLLEIQIFLDYEREREMETREWELGKVRGEWETSLYSKEREREREREREIGEWVIWRFKPEETRVLRLEFHMDKKFHISLYQNTELKSLRLKFLYWTRASKTWDIT